MIVGLPIEISLREYTSKLFCLYQILKSTKYKIVLGKKSEVYSFYKNNSGVYLITKGGFLKNFSFKKNYFDNKLGLLDEEGPLTNFIYKSDFIARTNNKVLNKINDYYSWGEEDNSLIKKKNLEKKIILSGHPKYDLCNIKFRKYFDKKKKLLFKKYKKYILVASNCIADDGYIQKNDYIEWISKNVEKKLQEKKKKDLINYFNIDSFNYKKLIDLSKKISQKNKNINIIFRPHPRQDEKKVTKHFDEKKYKNIFVVKEGVITPYIYGAEIYIHSGCTTSFEAALLDKKIIFLKNKFNNSKRLYEKFGYTIDGNNIDIILDIINNKKKYNYKLNNIKKYIYNNSNNFFYKILIQNLKRINLKSQKIKKNIPVKQNLFFIILKNLFLKYTNFSKIISLFDPNFLLSKDYKDSKFEKIPISRLKTDIKKFQTIDNKKFKFKIQKIDNNSFLVSR